MKQLLNEYPDGVYFIPLTAITEAELVLLEIVEFFGIKRDGLNRTLANLKEYLRSKQLLIILDNFEQVIEAATLLVELLEATLYLNIVVTSRESLRVRGEQEYLIEALALPQPELAVTEVYFQSDTGGLVANNPAIALFVERVKALKPEFNLNHENFPVISQLCNHLEGLPLAIELAAAQSKLLTPAQLLTQLQKEGGRLRLLKSRGRNYPTKQQTLEKTLDWGYQLLSESEQKLFRGLGIFAGSFSLVAVSEISGQPGEVVTEGLTLLLEKSFLQAVAGNDTAEPRFRMLETIREFAIEKLRENEEYEVSLERYTNYFLGLAEKGKAELDGGVQQEEWLNILSKEQDNFRSSLSWLMEKSASLGTTQEAPENAQLAKMARLFETLVYVWVGYGQVEESQHWLDKVLLHNITIPQKKTLENHAKRIPDINVKAVENYLLLLRTGDNLRLTLNNNLERYGLANGKFRLLVLIYEEIEDEGRYPTVFELAVRSGYQISTVNSLLDALEEAGLITYSSPHDARERQVVCLTRAGLDNINTNLPDHFRRINSLMTYLNEEELVQLEALLKKVRQGMPAFGMH